MAKQNPETILTNQIKQTILDHYPEAWFYKTLGGRPGGGRGARTRSGVPDLIVACAGNTYYLEIKTKRGRPTETQLNEIKQLQNAGVPAAIIRTPEAALEFIAEHKRT